MMYPSFGIVSILMSATGNRWSLGVFFSMVFGAFGF